MSDPSRDDPKAEAQARIAAMAEPRRGQVYEHYKGGLYCVVSVSIKEDTLEVMVTYSSNLMGGDTTRTLANFTEEIMDVLDGRMIPRFRRADR